MRSSDSINEEHLNRTNDQRSPQRAAEDRARRERTPEHLREPKQKRLWIPDNDPYSDDPQ